MSDHERISGLLPLAAAGLLDPEEERALRRHAAGCADCSAALRVWQAIGAGFAALPQPSVPRELAAATHRRLAAALSAEAARRWDEAVLACLALFGWTVGLSMWAVYRMLGGGYGALVEVGWAESLVWLTGTTVLAWLTAGVAAALAAQRRKELWRRL